jgi:hypothetical protein
MLDPLAGQHTRKELFMLARPARRKDQADRLLEDLFRGVAVEGLRSLVPALDPAARIGCDDRVDRGLDDLRIARGLRAKPPLGRRPGCRSARRAAETRCAAVDAADPRFLPSPGGHALNIDAQNVQLHRSNGGHRQLVRIASTAGGALAADDLEERRVLALRLGLAVEEREVVAVDDLKPSPTPLPRLALGRRDLGTPDVDGAAGAKA